MLSWLALGCAPVLTGQVVSSVQMVPSTRPIAPGSYVPGPVVGAERCDFVDDTFQFRDLLYEAIGTYDALVDVVLEQYDQIRYRVDAYGDVQVLHGNRRCFRVTGRAVTLFDPE